MFGRDSGDVTVLCPFDNTHVILAKSLNSHLVKCRKNHQHLKKVPCKFDRTHMVLKPELQHHHSVCPSRMLLDREIQLSVGGSNTLMGAVSGPEIQSAYFESTEDDWDAGARHQPRTCYSDEEDEEDEEFYFRHLSARYDPSAAASSSSSSSSMPSREENFRRLPLAPSKAAQLSAPMSTKPKGSSSLVYEYSLQQAVLGRGRGRGMPVKAAQKGNSAITPMGMTQGGNTVYQSTASAPHLGRGISRYATQDRQKVGVSSVTPSQMSSVQGRGTPPSSTLAPSYQDAFFSGPSHHQAGLASQQTQFEDSEDLQAQKGGTSTAEVPVSLASKAGAEEQLFSVEGKIQELLLKEELEHEQLKRQQQLRRENLVQHLRQQQILKQQQQQSSPTYAHTVAAASQSNALPSPSTTISPSSPNKRVSRGRGRGLERNAVMRAPLNLSNSQSLQAQNQGKDAFLKCEDHNQEQLAETSIECSGLRAQNKSEDINPAFENQDQELSAEASVASAGSKVNQKQDYSKMSAEELKKVKRKVEKKMKQIQALEKKESLSPEEDAKLKKKDSLLKDLEKISHYL